jgi:hypothetical protein
VQAIPEGEGRAFVVGSRRLAVFRPFPVRVSAAGQMVVDLGE